MSKSRVRPSEPGAGEPQLWPIFICYRQVDGLAAARRLHELLDKRQVTGPKGEPILLDVYLDQTMPAVADWREIHRPYLKKARAFIVVCTPGAKIIDGPDDWVHKEIRWWLNHRTPVPILIDPLRQGIRYVPAAISKRWPEIQRIPLVEAEWTNLEPAALEEKASALRRQIIGNILPSNAAIYAAELEAERQRQRITQAALYDAQAASHFDEARRVELRWEAERQRQLELKRSLAALLADEGANTFRKQNLNFEIKQLGETMKELSAAAAGPRSQGYARLKQADRAWDKIRKHGPAEAVASRAPSNAPYIFSIEMINAGSGESILVHYGTPDLTRLVMINGGTRPGFNDTVRKRLHSLKAGRFHGSPTPIELFVASDQDVQKTGGLLEMLVEMTNGAEEKDRVVALRLIWANIFAASGFRGAIRELMQKAGIPLNAPFDHHVMRPARGHVRHVLPGELEIVVLGPAHDQLENLHRSALRNHKGERQAGGKSPVAVVEPFAEERFSRMTLEHGDPLPPPPRNAKSSGCLPSDNARKRASVAATDMSVPNLASTILLFRFRGKTFLHTGDSRADLILNALISSGLMEPEGRAHVDLLLLPHQGSNNNLTPEFLERVAADRYLFSGDWTHSNPRVETIAALIAARPCADYTMYFVNRDSETRRNPSAPPSDDDDDADRRRLHAESVDAFFAAEEQYNPRYRRVFRATDQGSVIIDLLDRVTY